MRIITDIRANGYFKDPYNCRFCDISGKEGNVLYKCEDCHLDCLEKNPDSGCAKMASVFIKWKCNFSRKIILARYLIGVKIRLN